MQALLGKKLKDKSAIKEGDKVWFDGDVYVLVHYIKNRWTFECSDGIFILNDIFMDKKIEEGVFEVKAIK